MNYHYSSPSFRVKQPLSIRLEKGVYAILILISIVIVSLVTFYIVYHNKNATLGYKLRILQEERKDLLTKSEALSMKIADLSTIERLETLTQQKQMVSSNNSIYLVKDESLAKR